jgi:copper chaperone CopZ
MKFRRIHSLGILAVLVLVAGGWLLWPRGLNPDQAALAQLGIDNLTCGSCVENVKVALAALPGIGQVEVSVTSGTGRVEYDPRRTDARTISARIGAAGYPSRVTADLNVAEYRALRERSRELSTKYVAEIGTRLVSKAEFQRLVALRGKSPGDSPRLAEAQLRQAVWEDLLQRELLMGVAESQGVVIQDGEVQHRLKRLCLGHSDFKQIVQERFGSLDNLAKQLKTEMIIDRTLREKVLPPGLDAGQQTRFLQRWYGDLILKTPVTIFDPTLETTAAGTSGGCGGSCCNRKS